jgi:hypothetical protein
MAGSQEALDRFERQTAWPMMALALAIIPLLVVPLLVDLSPAAETTFLAIDWLILIAFVLEYGIRLYLAPNKRHFVSTTSSAVATITTVGYGDRFPVTPIGRAIGAGVMILVA